MNKASTNHLPSYLSSMVSWSHPVKGHSSIRSASDGKYVVPGARLIFGQRSFTVAGPTVCNSLPPHVRNSLTETIFHAKLKTHLFSSTWILMISRLQYALLNFVRRAISNNSCIVL